MPAPRRPYVTGRAVFSLPSLSCCKKHSRPVSKREDDCLGANELELIIHRRMKVSVRGHNAKKNSVHKNVRTKPVHVAKLNVFFWLIPNQYHILKDTIHLYFASAVLATTC